MPARAFGGDPADTGLVGAGPTPSGDEAVIGVDLADALHIGPGDRIGLFAFGQNRALTVRNVVPRLGLAGFHPGFASRAHNVFVAPGTLAALAASTPAGAVPPEGRVLVSNQGDVFDSTGPSDAVVLELQIRTAGLGPVEITDEKQQTLDFADRQGDNFSRLFGLIGSFTVVAGVLLLVNTFVMLAEERKSELGTLRARWASRDGISCACSGWKGTAYSLVATAFGVLAGIAVGRVVVRATEGIFAQGQRGIVGLKFAVTPPSLFAGFFIGLAIALITVWGTSVRISRLNIIRAIRDTPEPLRKTSARHLRLDAAGVIVGAAIFAFGLVRSDPVAALLGPSLTALCLVPLLTTWTSRRLAVSLPSLVLLVYAILAFNLLPSVFDDSDTPVFFVQGLVLVLSGVVLVVANDDRFRMAEQTAGRSRRRTGHPPRLGKPTGKTPPNRLAAGDVRAHRVRARLHGGVRSRVPGAGAADDDGDKCGLRPAGRQHSRESRQRRSDRVGRRRRAGDPVGTGRGHVPVGLGQRHDPATADRIRRVAPCARGSRLVVTRPAVRHRRGGVARRCSGRATT